MCLSDDMASIKIVNEEMTIAERLNNIKNSMFNIISITSRLLANLQQKVRQTAFLIFWKQLYIKFE